MARQLATSRQVAGGTELYGYGVIGPTRYASVTEWAVSLILMDHLSLYHNCDSTTIRRYHDAFDYDESDRNYDLRSIRLRYDYDTTTTKNWHVHFLLASNRARYVVVGS